MAEDTYRKVSFGYYECPECGYLYEQYVDLDIKTELEIHTTECLLHSKKFLKMVGE